MKQCKKSWLYPGLLAAQLAVVTVLALAAPLDLTLDCDAAKVFTNVVEMWRTGSLVIPGWSYLTTMELDCATLLALPLYGLTGNVLTAFRAVSVALPFLWAALVIWLCGRLGAERTTGCAAAALVIMPYAFGMLDYWNMLFFGAAQYTVKLAVPLLWVGLFLCTAPRRRDGALLAAACLLTGCAAFSSGVYLPVCGLAPVWLYAGLQWLRQRRRPSRWEAVCLGSGAASALLGLALGRAVNATAKGNAMVLNSAHTLADNALKAVGGLFQLFGAVKSDDKTAVLSVQGVRQVLLFCLVLVLLAVLVKSRLTGPQGYLTALAVWNVFVLLVCDTRYREEDFEVRYLLMVGVPLLILLALRLPRLPARAGAAALCVLALACDTSMWQQTHTGITAQRVYAQMAVGLVQAAAPLDVNTVYIESPPSDIAEICRALDPDGVYLACNPHDGTLAFFDYYTDRADATRQQGSCLLALRNAEVSTLPVWVQSRLTEVGFTESHRLYRAENLPLDGVCGLPTGDHMVDYPNSPVYVTVGELDAERHLHAAGTSENTLVLRSPTLTLHTLTNITLHYQWEGGDPGQLELWVEEQQLMVLPLDGSADTAVFNGIAPGRYILKVTLPEGSRAVLEQFDFDAT